MDRFLGQDVYTRFMVTKCRLCTRELVSRVVPTAGAMSQIAIVVVSLFRPELVSTQKHQPCLHFGSGNFVKAGSDAFPPM